MPLIRKLSLTLVLLVGVTGVAVAQTPSRIVNLSSRVFCQTGDAVAVNEFIVYGRGDAETFLLRGLGPSFAGIFPDPLQDPTLRLLDARGRSVDRNDNWVDNPDKQEIIDIGLAPTNDLEPAIIDTLKSGTYTSVVQGTHRGEGMTVSELYDLSDGDLQLSAIGTRAFVGTGDNGIISGFIIIGAEPITLLIRVLGRSLADAGLDDVLADPIILLYDGNGSKIATNNDWKQTQQAEIEATGLAPTDDLESALIVTINPGAYSTVVTGRRGGTGLGFVQFYSLDATHP